MAHTCASIQINKRTGSKLGKKTQQLFPLTGYPTRIQNKLAYSREKKPQTEVIKFQLHTRASDLPYRIEPVVSQMLILCSDCQVLGQPVPFWGTLWGRSSGQVVLVAARALPENSPTGLAGH